MVGEEKLTEFHCLSFCRPLWVEFPGKLETFGVENEYMLGKQVWVGEQYSPAALRYHNRMRLSNHELLTHAFFSQYKVNISTCRPQASP